MLAGRDSPALAAILRDCGARLRTQLLAAVSSMDAAARRRHTDSLALAVLAITLLREIDRAGFHVLGERSSLTPLRRHWIAWRVRWSTARGRPPAG